MPFQVGYRCKYLVGQLRAGGCLGLLDQRGIKAIVQRLMAALTQP